MRSWPVYSGLNKHKIDKIINSQITTHTLNWHQCSVLEQQECKQYCKQYNIIYKSNTHKTWVENSQITTHTVCARCAEQRGPDLGGKAEKNWNGLPTLVRSKTRTGVLKTNWIGSPDRDFPVQADPILICIFLLISAADPIQISDRDIPSYNTVTGQSSEPRLLPLQHRHWSVLWATPPTVTTPSLVSALSHASYRYN